MKHYAIYDVKTGRILQTHVVVNAEGKPQDASDEEILGTPPPDIPRETVRVTSFEKKHESGATSSVDIRSGEVLTNRSRH